MKAFPQALQLAGTTLASAAMVACSTARSAPVAGKARLSPAAGAELKTCADLVQWVEQGEPPPAVVATARGFGNGAGVNADVPADWAPNRTRPLCAHPTVATYQGSDPIEDASRFSCL